MTDIEALFADTRGEPTNRDAARRAEATLNREAAARDLARDEDEWGDWPENDERGDR